jgi:hypothetical protein
MLAVEGGVVEELRGPALDGRQCGGMGVAVLLLERSAGVRQTLLAGEAVFVHPTERERERVRVRSATNRGAVYRTIQRRICVSVAERDA